MTIRRLGVSVEKLGYSAFITFWGCLLVLSQASAASSSFVAVVNELERVATVDAVTLGEVRYVSLRQLADQFNAGYNVLPTRMRIDFMGRTAWVQTNDDRVDALSIFSLRHPIRRQNREILIAEEDVQPFFQKAFRVEVHRYTPVAPTPLPAPSPVPDTAPTPILEPPDIVPGGSTEAPSIHVIIIDPGHGGYDSGIEGASGLLEKDLSLQIALKLEALLRQTLSQKIVLTRKGDIPLTVEERAKVATNARGDMLITLHGGGSMSSNISGGAFMYTDLAPQRAGHHLPPRTRKRLCPPPRRVKGNPAKQTHRRGPRRLVRRGNRSKG